MKFVTRNEWGAAPYTCSQPLPPVDNIVYHYSAANADEQAEHRHCAARVRGIQRYHQQTRGWCDIAYNFVVCKHGYVFEGRGIARKSGATGTANSHTIAVCFLGDDTAGRDDLTPLGRAALVDVTRYIQARKGPKGYKGHRDYMQTSCPGNEIYNYIHSAAFRAAVNVDEKKALRAQILRWRAAGMGWKAIFQTETWKRFRALGGK